MPKILTNLRIDEISSVDRGAGEGVKILLMKRDDDTSHGMFGSHDIEKLSEEIDDDDDPATPDKMEQFAAILMLANPNLSREDAVHYLTHHAQGQATARHLAEITKAKEEPVMSRTEQLRSIAKDFGVHKLAKYLIDDDNAHGISEFEMTRLIHDEAQKTKRQGESSDQAFARYYSDPDNLDLRKALQIAKSVPNFMELEPEVVGGADAVDVNDASAAYTKMTELAEEQRKRSPTLTVAQCFARVFEDPANKSLAAAAHIRPSATTSYAMPR